MRVTRPRRSGERLLVLALWAAFMVAIAGPARADDGDASKDEKVEEASAHFERGLDLAKDGSYEGALVEFRRAYELAPHYQLRNNMAVVLSAMHDYVGAVREFENYLAEGGEQISEDQRQQVAAEIDLLRKRLAKLVVEVNVSGAKILVDGKVVASSPMSEPVVVNVGARKVEVSAKGYKPASETIELFGEESRKLVLELEKEVPLVVAPLPKKTPVREPSRTGAWIATGLTVALGAGAGVAGLLAFRADSDLDEAFAQASPDPGNVSSIRDRIDRWSLTADVLTGLTAVAGGVSIYLWVRGGDSGVEASSSASFRVGVEPGAVVLSGQF